MEINCNTKARILNLVAKYNEGKGETKRAVDVSLGCDRNQFAKTFGLQLCNVIFAAYVADEQEVGCWKLKSPKLSKRHIPGNHKIAIDGHGFVMTPKVLKFIPVEDTEKVVAILRIELGQAQENIIKMLYAKLGNEVSLMLEPSEMELPLGTNLADRKMEIVKGGSAK
jgi:hypothetical protein